jgi:hypothetical protein
LNLRIQAARMHGWCDLHYSLTCKEKTGKGGLARRVITFFFKHVSNFYSFVLSLFNYPR